MVQTDECINYEDVTPLSGNRFGTWGEFGFGAAFKKKNDAPPKDCSRIEHSLSILLYVQRKHSGMVAEF